MNLVGFRYTKADHTYAVKGRVVPSVTGVIAAGGLLDRSSPFYTEEARHRGTLVHAACLCVDLGVPPVFEGGDIRIEAFEEISGYVESYQKWRRFQVPAWSHLEQPAYSAAYDFGGCADRVGAVHRNPLVVDFKTGTEEEWHRYQLALYDLLYSDLPPRIRRRLSLYLHPDGKCARQVEHTDPSDYDRALRLLRP